MVCLKYVWVFLLLLGLPVQAHAETLTYNLRQAVDRALSANPSMEAKQLAVERAQMDIGVAQSYFWPNVSLSRNWSKLQNFGGAGNSEDNTNKMNSKGVRATLSLFAGFAHLNNVQKAFLNVDMERARHRQAKLELIANVQLQFLQLLKSREDMKTVLDSKKRIETQLKAAEAFVEVGMAPYLNVLQNEVELTKVNQQEIRVMNSIRNSEVVLNRYLGYGTNDRVEYTGDLKDFSGVVGFTEEEAIDKSMYSRPDLIMAQKSVAVALKQSHVTAGRYLPNVNLTYDYVDMKRRYNDEGYSKNNYKRSYWNVGINVSWDVFDGGNTTFTLMGDRKAAASLRKEYEDAMAAARAEVIRSLLDIQAAKELITASRKGLEAASESYAMADKRYKTSTGTITELLDAQLRLTQAEEDYSLSLTEFHSSRSRFFYSIGMENPSLE